MQDDNNYRSKRQAGNLLFFGIFLLMMYSYSRYSWGYIFSNVFWAALMVLSVLLLFAGSILQSSGRINKDVSSLFLILMLAIIALNNNYDIKQGSVYSAILPFLSVSVVYLFAKKNGRWIKPTISIMKIIGLFYAIMTFVCISIPTLYYSVIVPIMSKYGTSYTAHPSAGFTAHYSTNGIYLSMGFCTIAGSIFFDRRNGKIIAHPLKLVPVLIMTLALLMNGKSGTLICIIVAVFIAYRNYTIVHKRGRLFKILAFLIGAIFFLYILSSIFPSIAYVVDRFNIELGDGDVSNGRFAIWNYAWLLIIQKPLPFGRGWRWYRYNNTISPKSDVHNCFIQLLLENGYIGSIPFIAFLVIEMIRAYKLSIEVIKNSDICKNDDVSMIYIALLNEVFMLCYMFEGTAIYMPECMLTYFISCAVIEYYRLSMKKASKAKV